MNILWFFNMLTTGNANTQRKREGEREWDAKKRWKYNRFALVLRTLRAECVCTVLKPSSVFAFRVFWTHTWIYVFNLSFYTAHIYFVVEFVASLCTHRQPHISLVHAPICFFILRTDICTCAIIFIFVLIRISSGSNGAEQFSRRQRFVVVVNGKKNIHVRIKCLQRNARRSLMCMPKPIFLFYFVPFFWYMVSNATIAR